MSTLSELWAGYIAKNPSAANNPVPFQTPMNAPVISNPVNVTAPNVNKPIFNQSNTAPVSAQMPKDYINPATGQLYTPTEYANNVASKIPITQPQKEADIPTYAGNNLTNPNRTAADLQMVTTNLNNARNDIATGTTDPYMVGNKSGVAYSPEELRAIEKAYAGIYDPAINSAMTRLDTKQKQDAAELKAKQDREDQIFATNESIRQWKATTGTGPTYTDGGSGTQFTNTQLNNGASNAGMTIEGFSKLDKDLQNFYVNPPTELNPETNKMVPQYETFSNLVKGANKGAITSKEAADEIEASNLPESIKHYFIDQLTTLPVAEKEGYFSRLWNAIKGK